mmetsp:Transcript_15413/g.35530  ORF Transcript_15413/g.35530 Transcript_15413/m.35530 type:complete len:310 (+) Transcript_15413:221-1150(+)
MPRSTSIMKSSLLLVWLVVVADVQFIDRLGVADAFVARSTTPTKSTRMVTAGTRGRKRSDTHILNAAPKIKQTPEQKARRKELLKRNGPYFQLDKLSGSIEFGAATKLVTDLSQNKNCNKESIEQWLSDNDGKGLALSIWDESLMEVLPDSVYRLQTMPLKFVTLELQPSVDLQMWTQPSGKNRAGRQLPPIFKLNSVGFETNLRLLPGMGVVSSESLGIFIEVAGDLRPSEDGKGVTGTISFQTKGLLPGPLRLLPQSALKVAADTINDKIVELAVASFEKGAIGKYDEFMRKQTAKATTTKTTDSSP